MLDKREIVAWTDRRGHYRFPRWQFLNQEMLPGVAACLKSLDSDDQWAVMRYFLAPSEMSGGLTPLQLLRNGRIAAAKAIAVAASVHDSK